MSWESLQHFKYLTLTSLANLSSATKVSYLPWLFVVSNSNLRDCSRMTSSRLSRMTSFLLLFSLDELSTFNLHHSDFNSILVDSLATKLAKHYAFMGPLGSYLIPNSNNLIDQTVIRPTSFGFFMTIWMGWSIRTTI